MAACGYTPVEAISTAVNGWFMAFDNEHAGGFEPPGQCSLSPQCGFSSAHHGKPLLQVDPWRKLERVITVARRGGAHEPLKTHLRRELCRRSMRFDH